MQNITNGKLEILKLMSVAYIYTVPDAASFKRGIRVLVLKKLACSESDYFEISKMLLPTRREFKTGWFVNTRLRSGCDQEATWVRAAGCTAIE